MRPKITNTAYSAIIKHHARLSRGLLRVERLLYALSCLILDAHRVQSVHSIVFCPIAISWYEVMFLYFIRFVRGASVFLLFLYFIRCVRDASVFLLIKLLVLYMKLVSTMFLHFRFLLMTASKNIWYERNTFYVGYNVFPQFYFV